MTEIKITLGEYLAYGAIKLKEFVQQHYDNGGSPDDIFMCCPYIPLQMMEPSPDQISRMTIEELESMRKTNGKSEED